MLWEITATWQNRPETLDLLIHSSSHSDRQLKGRSAKCQKQEASQNIRSKKGHKQQNLHVCLFKREWYNFVIQRK